MSYRARYDKGDWAVICDSCGKKFKASSLIKRWDGIQVCPTCWEPRQPQDFVRGVADIQTPAWTRPEVANVFIPSSSPAVAMTAIAGACVPNTIPGPGPIPSSTFTI